jgi:hypothetical protein
MVEAMARVPLLTKLSANRRNGLDNAELPVLDLADLSSCMLSFERNFNSLYPNQFATPVVFSSFVAHLNRSPVFVAIGEDNHQRKIYLMDIESKIQLRAKLIDVATIVPSGPSFVTRDDKLLFWNFLGCLEVMDLDTLECVFKVNNFGELKHFRETEDTMFAYCANDQGILRVRLSDMSFEKIGLEGDQMIKGILSSHYLSLKQDILHKFHTHSKQSIMNLPKSHHEIQFLLISPNEKLAAIVSNSNHKSFITLLSTIDFKVLQEFCIPSSIQHLTFSLDSHLLLILSNTNTLHYFYTLSSRFLSYHLKLETQLHQIHFLSNRSILGVDKDSNIFIWHCLPEGSEVLPEPNLNCTYFPLPGNLLLCASPFEATVFNEALMSIESIEIGRVSEVCYSDNNLSCYLLVKDLHIVKVDLGSFQPEVLNLAHAPEKLLKVLMNGRLMYLSDGKLVIYGIESRECLFSMDVESVSDMVVIERYGLVMLPSYHASTVNLFKFEENSLVIDELNSINLNSPLEKISVTLDNRYLLLALANWDLQIRDAKSRSLLETFSFSSPILSISCTSKQTALISESSGKISFLNTSSLSILTSILYHKDPISCYITPNEQYILLNTKFNSLRIKNPMNNSSFQITGSDSEFQVYMDHLHDIFKKKAAVYSTELKELIMNPGTLRVQDLYVYFSMRKALKLSYKGNLDSLVQLNSINLIEHCLKKDDNSSLGVLIKCMIDYLPENHRIAAQIEPVMIQLNQNGHPLLHQLYNNLLQSSSQDGLPPACSIRVQLPKSALSESQQINPSALMRAEFYQSKDQIMEFKYSVLPLNYEIGSQDSIDFLYSLLKCSNDKVLGSESVQIYINMIWNKAKWVVIIQTIIYSIYLVILCIHTTWDENTTNIVFLIIFNTTLLIIEAVQFRFSGLKYWKDTWNLIDLCRLILGYWYFIAWFYDSEDSTLSRSLFLLVLFVSFIRGISYFRIAKKTRYFINLLEEVFLDIYGFMAILVYSVLAYLFLSIQMNKDDSNGSTDFDTNYGYTLSLLFGDLATSPSDWVEWAIATIFLVLNPIIMFNLLISILGDTYGRVQSNSDIADAKELIELVIEVSDMMYWRRDLKIKKYYIMCEKKNLMYEEQDEQQKAYKKVWKKLEDIREEQSRLRDDIERKMQVMNKNVMEILYEIRSEIKIKNEGYSAKSSEIK